MKNLLPKLVHILKIDTEIDELLEFKESIPSAIEFFREELAALQTEHQAQNAKLINFESEKSQKEASIAEGKDFLVKREETAQEIKNNKEFHAVQKEINQSKRNIAILEEEIQRLVEQIEEIKPVVAELEQGIATQAADIEKKIAEKLEESKKLDFLIEEKIALRGNEEGLITPELLKKYKFIKSKIKPAMALADSGNCTECSTRIPPQMYIEIQKMDSLVICPRCHRILFINEAA